MEEKLSKAAKMIVDLFRDPEQSAAVAETADALRALIDSLESDVLSSLQELGATSVFDDLPSNHEASVLRELTAQRDSLRSEVLHNRLRLALALAQLQRHGNYI